VAPPTVTVPAVKKPVTIKFMSWGGVDRHKPRVALFQKSWPETASWLNVEVVSPGAQDADVNNAFRLALSAGGKDVPDIIQFNYISVPEFARAGAFLDIGKWMAAYDKDITPGAKTLSMYSGQVWCVPSQVKGKMWFYRKDLFEKAGIDPNAIKTFDNYVAAGKKFHEVNPKSYIMNIGPQPFGPVWYFSILSHWDDVRVADDNGNYQLTKNPHFAEVFTWLKTMNTSGIAFKTDDWSPDWQPAIGDGSIAGFLIHTWMSSFLPQFAPTQKGLWTAALQPDFNRYGSGEGGDVMCIPAGAKNPEAAFEFLSKMYLETKGAVEFSMLTGYVPSVKSALPVVRERNANLKRPDGITDAAWAATPAVFFGPEVFEAGVKSMDVVKVFPYDPKALAELAIMQKHSQAFIADKETLEQALAGAQSDMEKQIGNPYKS
jgi:ABC-type glycerol-3-phosphate transport system substrate-binding protein